MSLLLARDLAADLHAGQTTPRAVLEQVARAIAAHEGEVQAFAALDLDRARAAADQAGLAGLPLAGLPVGVKDIIDTRDLPTAYGSPLYAGHRPRNDAPVVAMTRRAGGIIVGKTVTTEFAFLKPSQTRNPRRLTHSPGGSSAGSAAAVGAGMVPLALGTQTGGSVIRPASFCGAAAIKPSFRLIPTVGVKCQAWTLDTLGLFAARIEDLAAAFEAVTGRPSREEERTAPRLGIVRQDFAGEAESDGVAALDEAIARCERAGAAVIDLSPSSGLREGWAAHATINDFEAAVSLAWEHEHEGEGMPPKLRAMLDRGSRLRPAEYDEARRVARQARHEARDLFGDVDAILTYAAPGIAPRLDLGTTGDARYNRLWTLLGTPCVNVPGLSGTDGFPVGIQVVAPFGRDARALDVAAFVEAALSPPP